MIANFNFEALQCEWWPMNPPYYETFSWYQGINTTEPPTQNLVLGDILVDYYVCPSVISTIAYAYVAS